MWIFRKVIIKRNRRYANGVGAMATLVKGDCEGYPDYDKLMSFIGKSKNIER